MKLGPSPLPTPPARGVTQALIRTYLDARKALRAMTPPQVTVMNDTMALARAQMIGAIVRVGVPELLSAGPMAVSEIARRTRTQLDPLRRVLRALALIGYVEHTGDDRYGPTRLLEALREGDGSMAPWVRYFTSRSNVDAWVGVEETLRTGRNGFEAHHGMTVWEWFEQHPDEREDFAQAMTTLTIAEAGSVVSAYPRFGELQTVCDVGGGRGVLLSEILVRHPSVRGILCDYPRVLDSARLVLQQRGVTERVQLCPGSFFNEVPAGADAYVLKHVLHDWGDDDCVKILRVVRAAAKPGARVLLVEGLLEPGTVTPSAEADVQMMVVCKEGRERGRDEYRALLSRAGFTPGAVFEGRLDAAVIEGFA